jgi:hypothetical protein
MRVRLLVTALTVCLSGKAAVTTFTSSSDYYSALAARGIVAIVEGYEAYPSDTLVNSNAIGGLTYTFPSDVSGRVDSTYNHIGGKSLAADRGTALTDFFISGDSIRIDLPKAAFAAGIFINSPVTVSSGDYALRTSTGAAVAGGGAGTYDTGTLYFLGLIDDTPFTSVTLESVEDVRGFNVDDFSYGVAKTLTAAPEPSTFALLAGGLIAAGFIKRRR